MFEETLADAGVASFETLAESCVALGVLFLACDSGLRTMGIEPEALRAEFRVELAGAFTYLRSGAAGDLLFV
jgi:peroxiredoxin family protein